MSESRFSSLAKYTREPATTPQTLLSTGFSTSEMSLGVAGVLTPATPETFREIYIIIEPDIYYSAPGAEGFMRLYARDLTRPRQEISNGALHGACTTRDVYLFGVLHLIDFTGSSARNYKSVGKISTDGFCNAKSVERLIERANGWIRCGATLRKCFLHRDKLPPIIPPQLY